MHNLKIYCENSVELAKALKMSRGAPGLLGAHIETLLYALSSINFRRVAYLCSINFTGVAYLCSINFRGVAYHAVSTLGE